MSFLGRKHKLTAKNSKLLILKVPLPHMIRGRQLTGVLANDWLPVPIAFAELVPAFPLGTARVADLEPRALLAVAHVRAIPVIRDDSFRIDLTCVLEQGEATSPHDPGAAAANSAIQQPVTTALYRC